MGDLGDSTTTHRRSTRSSDAPVSVSACARVSSGRPGERGDSRHHAWPRQGRWRQPVACWQPHGSSATPPYPQRRTTTRCECAPVRQPELRPPPSGPPPPAHGRRPPRRPECGLCDRRARPEGGGPLGRVRPSHLPSRRFVTAGGPQVVHEGLTRVRAGRHDEVDGRRATVTHGPHPHTAALDPACCHASG